MPQGVRGCKRICWRRLLPAFSTLRNGDPIGILTQGRQTVPQGYLKPSAATLQVRLSWADAPPLQPMAPTNLPLSISG